MGGGEQWGSAKDGSVTRGGMVSRFIVAAMIGFRLGAWGCDLCQRWVVRQPHRGPGHRALMAPAGETPATPTTDLTTRTAGFLPSAIPRRTLDGRCLPTRLAPSASR